MVNYYQRIYEAVLSGASRGYLKNRHTHTMNPETLADVRNNVRVNKLHKSIPQKLKRQNYRSTDEFSKNKLKLHNDRLKRKGSR